ncbi:GyrI-like domain-containing protein [Mucisphaera calidilacus]|uniref:Bacterial transcription activator, effector binding domain n=1 Tax=Mucisphaera calidilacus TaxID=2527982 RepID=A0A518BZU4_9BACT|nr:GyrI-like domain-containing protein [Mucisphaera calidilacus]QDU72498.1 Bacterial transcription activator, effector binding domain [Mucisphaera calidilacus]
MNNKVVSWIVALVLVVVSAGVLVMSVPGVREVVLGGASVRTSTTNPQDYDLTEPQVTVLEGAEYFLFGEAETTLNSMGETMDQKFWPLVRMIEEQKLDPEGDVVFVYLGATGEPDDPFTLRMGFPVVAGTKAPEGFRIDRLPDLRCVKADFTGHIEGVGHAYSKIMPALFQSGHQPSGETREVYREWHGPDSVDNRVDLCVGIQ